MTTGKLSGLANAYGLEKEDKATVDELVRVYESMLARNSELDGYFDGDVAVQDYGVTVNPDLIRNDQVCHWPQKAVTALAERVRFDGFALDGDASDPSLDKVMRDSNLASAYARYLPSCLTHGCMFATVGRYGDRTYVRLHDAETAAAIPDGEHESGTVGAGIAIARSERTAWSPNRPVPTVVNMYLPGSVTTFTADAPSMWTAVKSPVPERTPMMLAFAHKATGTRPLGQSRITSAVKSLTRDAIRTMWRMEVSSAFYSMPQRYILGLTDEQYDAIVSAKTKVYIDSMFLATQDAEGNHPTYGQLPANSPQPFIDQLRTLASMFSGATGVPLNSLGIVQDNPSSAEAIAAAREDICIAAEDQIEADKGVLRKIALMAMAVEGNTTVEGLTDAQKSVMARFRDPAMPSIVSQADAMVKIAGVAPFVTESEVFWERIGFDEATRRRIMAAKREGDSVRMVDRAYSLPQSTEETDG